MVFRELIAWLMPNGMLTYTFFPPPSKYDPQRDMPDLSGKVALVTGQSGIGFEIAKQLVLKHVKVYIGARNKSRALEAVKQLEQVVEAAGAKGEAIWLELDLGDLDSVKAAAEEFLRKEEQLDLLFCNAGVMVPPLDQLTKQGYDLQWGNRAAPGNTGLDWASQHGGPERDSFIKSAGETGAPWLLYGQSKLGNVMVSNILHRSYGNELVSMSLFLLGLLCYPASMGAYTLLWGATSAEGAHFGSQYLVPWARVGRADKRSSDCATLDKLEKTLNRELAPYLAA
ncbi:hypothetical protein Rhopal_005722-T1 [Rhodotorula paludigena]|uniref:NAD(P)-binding protein n=1 Tax=Rhodotorula paludigena TaxID=86838 RepID=A0AAV5GT51_9BASI|nr:hypothetical protein Rhopal_005722-T1 [Rhodotorula paludigena]